MRNIKKKYEDKFKDKNLDNLKRSFVSICDNCSKKNGCDKWKNAIILSCFYFIEKTNKNNRK